MNILALNWNDLKNPYAGGAEVHFEELLRRIVSYGHHVTLVCSGWRGCLPEETVEGIRIHRTGNRYNFNLVVPSLLRKLVKSYKYDILVEDINKIPFYTPLYLKLKTLIVIPHLFATTVFHEVNPILASYVYAAELPMIPLYRGRHFNVISDSTAKELIARGVPEKDVSVIHCGIDRKLYSHQPSIPKFERPTILYLGRIKKYKSIHHLIRAFVLVRAKLPDAHLMIVGDGDFSRPLEALAEKLGVNNSIDFAGYVPRDDKVDRLRRAHVAVLPSLKEGWGLTNIEANAVGTTVVAANTPGLRDSVKDNVSGLLYEYGHIDELASHLISILTDTPLRERLQQGGLRWASQFDWDTAAKSFESLLFDVLEGRR